MLYRMKLPFPATVPSRMAINQLGCLLSVAATAAKQNKRPSTAATTERVKTTRKVRTQFDELVRRTFSIKAGDTILLLPTWQFCFNQNYDRWKGRTRQGSNNIIKNLCAVIPERLLHELFQYHQIFMKKFSTFVNGRHRTQYRHYPQNHLEWFDEANGQVHGSVESIVRQKKKCPPVNQQVKSFKGLCTWMTNLVSEKLSSVKKLLFLLWSCPRDVIWK